MPPGPAARAAVVTVLPQERAARVKPYNRVRGVWSHPAKSASGKSFYLGLYGYTAEAKVSESYGFSASLVRLIMNLTCTYYGLLLHYFTFNFAPAPTGVKGRISKLEYTRHRLGDIVATKCVSSFHLPHTF